MSVCVDVCVSVCVSECVYIKVIILTRCMLLE